ncbi:Qb-snare protein, Bos1/Membrin family [Scenedesmus sp. NREL 46B-D3]|nr:Qb-snare protein, Bos1/Membrin family [Scenedesmus sp. NREL 46B-D3]
MSDLPGLHARATKLILALRAGLGRLESIEGPGDPVVLARDLHQKLAELQRISRELDSSWRMALVRQQTAKHDVWKRQQVSDEADFLRQSLDRFGGRQVARQREAADREELMARAEVGRQVKHAMDEEAAVMGHVTRSRRMMAEMFEQGGSILASMSQNRERIKRAQRKMLDVLNSVGMGESVLRMIERRHRADVYLALGGMATVGLLTCGLIWWRWF